MMTLLTKCIIKYFSSVRVGQSQSTVLGIVSGDQQVQPIGYTIQSFEHHKHGIVVYADINKQLDYEADHRDVL